MRGFLIALSLLLASCGPAPGPLMPVDDGVPPDFPADPYRAETGRRFMVAPAQSRVLLRVYRDGKLARLGHNHVISSDHLGGAVLLTDPVTGSRADLYLPVSSLVVDDPSLRQDAGAGFEYPLSQADRDATRSNMLGDHLLHASQYPFVRMRVVNLQAAASGWLATLQLEIQGRRYLRSVPLQLTLERCRLRVQAAFDVKQSELGLQAFSVLGGALRVRDLVKVAINVVALSREPDCSD